MASQSNGGVSVPGNLSVFGDADVNGDLNIDGAITVTGAITLSKAAGAGSPEAAITASPGATYLNTTDESFWVKKTGTGNTGWVELIAG